MRTLAILTALILVLTAASFAGNVVVTEVITGGTLTLTMPSNFTLDATTLGGLSEFNSEKQEWFAVEDSRGTGVGWNLGFNINQFTTAGTPARTVPTANFSMKIDEGNIQLNYGQTVDNTYGPISLHTTLTSVAGEEVELAHSTTGYGMGKYDILTNFCLVIPANTYAGTYTATLTATLNNVP